MSEQLKIGGKVLRTIPQKTWSQTNFSNLVYLDGVMANNTEKMMLEIEPTTRRIILGNAKVQQLDSNNNVTTQTKDYRVYLQGYLDNGGTGGTPSDNPTIPPIDDGDDSVTNVTYNCDLLSLWEAQELMSVFDVEYSTVFTDQIVIYDWGTGASKDNVIGFSYVHDGTTTEINRFKVKSTTRTDEEIHCLVYKCDITESGTPDYVAPSTIEEFLKKGTPVTFSKFPVKNTNGSFDWIFTKTITINPRDVYLVLFLKEKTITWDKKIAAKIQSNVGDESNAKTNIQYVWSDNEEDVHTGAITGTFYYCKPIGAKLKYNTYDY